MNRCTDRRKLSELDPVTFFIVTELMAIEREEQSSGRESGIPAKGNLEYCLSKVA